MVPAELVYTPSTRNQQATHLVVFQTEVCYTSHRSGLSFSQILVNDVNPIGDMVVGLVEQITSEISISVK